MPCTWPRSTRRPFKLPGRRTLPSRTPASASSKTANAGRPSGSSQRPAPASASAGDLCHFVANGHAKSAIVQADFSTLLRLLAAIAETFGVQDVDGLSIYDWFNRERRLQMERELLRIGDTDPELPPPNICAMRA